MPHGLIAHLMANAAALAKEHGFDIKTQRNERLYLPIRDRSEFKKLMR